MAKRDETSSRRLWKCVSRVMGAAPGALAVPLRCYASLGFALLSIGILAEPSPPLVAHAAPGGDCQPFENTRPLCMFSNPEDIAVLPGNNVLIVSEYGDHHGSQPGALVFYDIATEQARVAYDGSDSVKPAQYWGESDCDDPPGPLFSPHGVDLSQRSDGRWQLLVVQHGGRESVEFFEVVVSQDDLKLQWRGCAVAPSNAALNSVAAGKAGDFFTTQMMSTKSSWGGASEKALQPTGLVYRWTKRRGFERLPNSEGVMLNGIASGNDGRTLYVVYSGENLIKHIDGQTGETLAAVEVRAVDNLKWTADRSKLLAASFVGNEGSEAFARCVTSDVGVCPIAYAIVEVDPETLAKFTLFQNPMAPMGAGTVGLRVGSNLYVGTFSGNRILQVHLGGSHE